MTEDVCCKVFSYTGIYDPNRIVICEDCGVDYDYKLVRRDEVRLGHRCDRWVLLSGNHFAPCVLSTHVESLPCIGEVEKSRQPWSDYSTTFDKETVMSDGDDWKEWTKTLERQVLSKQEVDTQKRVVESLGARRDGVKEYVVGFAFSGDMVALIEKKRPAWQAMLLNGIGGAIEAGETQLEAMIREFTEETGVHISDWTKVMSLVYPNPDTDDVIVHFFKTHVDKEILSRIETTTDEFVGCYHWTDPSDWSNCVANLSWILPLCAYTKATYLPFEVGVLSYEG